MKPIEKYQEKFIALLKEAEQELGDHLTIKVSSRPKAEPISQYDATCGYRTINTNQYDFELHTNSYVI